MGTAVNGVAMGLMREQNLRNFVTLLSFLVWVVHVEAKKGSKPDWILLRKPQYEGSSDETKEEGTRKSETSDESLSQGVVDEQSTIHGFRNMVKSREDAKAEPEENTKSEDETKEEGTRKSETSDESLSQGVVDEQS